MNALNWLSFRKKRKTFKKIYSSYIIISLLHPVTVTQTDTVTVTQTDTVTVTHTDTVTVTQADTGTEKGNSIHFISHLLPLPLSQSQRQVSFQSMS